jgi:GT2 family glycosyltransferase
MIGFNQQDGPRYDVPYPLEYATACSLLINRKVFENVGGFDLEFENYMEDYDFSYRVKEAGFTMGYVPDAKVFHKVSRTLGEFTFSRWKYQGKSTVLFYRKDDRFSSLKLWIFLVWVTIREISKGRFNILPGFWRGVLDGLRMIGK